MYKYPNLLSKTEKKVFEEHVKVCRKCELDLKVLKIFESDFKKYGKEICLERFLNPGRKYLSQKKYRRAAESFLQAIEVEPTVGIKLWQDKNLRNKFISQCEMDKRAFFDTSRGIWAQARFSPDAYIFLMKSLLATVIGAKRGVDSLLPYLEQLFRHVYMPLYTDQRGRKKELKLPKLLHGKYEVSREIGRGPLSVVYETTDVMLGRKVAIKKTRGELKMDVREKERFMAEVKPIVDLRHQNIAVTYEIFRENDDLYIVFEYIHGKTLEEILNEKVRLNVSECLRAMSAICEALTYAHKKEIVHGDLRPSNILVSKDGHVKVMGFGIARIMKDIATIVTDKDIFGTLSYIAPEQQLGTVHKQSDIFSLGVCMYQMLTGELPFKGPNFLEQKQRMSYCRLREINPDLPKQLEQIIERCLQPEPDKRFSTADELKNALERTRRSESFH